MKLTNILPAIGLVVLFSSSGFAQEPTSKTELITHLEEVQKDCEWKTRNLTGGPKGKMLLHKRTMDDVLEQLKAGEPVDPKKIDKALEVHPG
ncbi:MAG TPA: hypothetical protein VFU31_20045 [Candidatus Binatia bacterium]|nr:hypothetical protein [Candidatus Binatia bacterium]